MPSNVNRKMQTNDWTLCVYPTISTGIANRQNSLHALPFDVRRVKQWGVTCDAAGVGSALVTLSLVIDNNSIADPIIYDLDSAAAAQFLSDGFDMGLTGYPKQGQIVKLDMSFDGGTALVESYFHLWIRYTA